MARALSDEDQHSRLLSTLAPRLAHTGRLQEALATARGITDGHWRAEALKESSIALAESGFQEGALAAAAAVEYEPWRAQTLISMSAILRELCLSKALEIARQIESRRWRATALAGMAGVLSKPSQELVLREALKAIQQIEVEDQRSSALADLAALFASHRPLLDDALRTARAILGQVPQAIALGRLLPHLAATGSWEDALASLQAIPKGYWRASALVELVPHLPRQQREDAVRQALTIIEEVTDTDHLVDLIQRITPYLVFLPGIDGYSLWYRAIHVLASGTRADVLRGLNVLLPLASILGGAESLVNISRAIRDVGQWWP